MHNLKYRRTVNKLNVQHGINPTLIRSITCQQYEQKETIGLREMTQEYSQCWSECIPMPCLTPKNGIKSPTKISCWFHLN